MRRRPFLLLGLLGLLALLGAFATQWLLSRPPGVTAANFERVQVGMTEAQVEGLLGPESILAEHDGPHRIWVAEHAWLEVWFDEGGRVAKKEPWASFPRVLRRRPPETFWEKLRRWVGL